LDGWNLLDAQCYRLTVASMARERKAMPCEPSIPAVPELRPHLLKCPSDHAIPERRHFEYVPGPSAPECCVRCQGVDLECRSAARLRDSLVLSQTERSSPICRLPCCPAIPKRIRDYSVSRRARNGSGASEFVLSITATYPKGLVIQNRTHVTHATSSLRLKVTV
jgi:hypothetical protein